MAYPYRSILNPIQFDDPSLLALGYAKQIAIDSGATLHILHVVEKFPALGEPEVSENDNIRGEDEARVRLTDVANQHLSGVKYQVHVAAAAPRALAKAVVSDSRQRLRRGSAHRTVPGTYSNGSRARTGEPSKAAKRLM